MSLSPSAGPALAGGGFDVAANWGAFRPGGLSTRIDWNCAVGTKPGTTEMSELPANPELEYVTGDGAEPFGDGALIRANIELGENDPYTQLGSGFAWEQGFSYSSIYVERAIRFVAATAGAAAGYYLIDGAGHKSMFISTTASGTVFINLDGDENGVTVRPILLMTGSNYNDTWLDPSPATKIPIGDFGLLATYCQWNTAGNDDGIFWARVNGVLCVFKNDVRYHATPDVFINAKHDFYHNNSIGNRPLIGGDPASITERQKADCARFLVAGAA